MSDETPPKNLDKTKKLSPEQMQKLQQIIMQQKLAGGGHINGNENQKAKKFSLKNIFISILQNMQTQVKFIDQFVNFVMKKDEDNSNDLGVKSRAPIRFGILVLVFFVFMGFIWTITAPLDSATVAIGTLMSSSNKKTINHLEGGVIKAIYVQLGDIVQAGDKLLEFDDSRIRSEYMSYLNQYRINLASETRLLAEINNEQKINYPEFLLKDKELPELALIIKTQNNLFHSKNKLQLAEKNSLEQKILQHEKQIEGLEAKQIALQKNLEITQDRLNANKQLQTKGHALKTTILEFESKEANIISELSVVDTDIIRAKQEIVKTEFDLMNLDSRNLTNSLSELREVQIRLAEAKEKFLFYQKSLERIIITSPVDGIINNLHYHTIGSSIPPNYTIMEISPKNDPLIIEAKIPTENIDSIRVGLESKIRFSAFKSRTTPSFSGKVVSLSPDVIVEQNQQAMDPKLAVGYYLARVELDIEEFSKLAKPRHLRLQPGMQAEVQIITGTRTLFQYMLAPITDLIFKGFKER